MKELSVKIHPSLIESLSIWFGSDEYSLWDVILRSAYTVDLSKVTHVYKIHKKSITGLEKTDSTFAIEFSSKKRECIIGLSTLPEELKEIAKEEITYGGFAYLYLRFLCKEPTAFLYPMLVPASIFSFMGFFGLWDHLILHNTDVLGFFAKPGCEMGCVRKVLSLHSLVGLLFILQIFLLMAPIALFYVQAPKYRSAFNYRITQSYSFVSIVVGTVIFVQLIGIFPFKQYGKFIELGFDPKVEKMFSVLKTKK